MAATYLRWTWKILVFLVGLEALAVLLLDKKDSGKKNLISVSKCMSELLLSQLKYFHT